MLLSSIKSSIKQIITFPFIQYNQLLESHPLFTKCITSGGMYAGGDVLAQYAETYNINRIKSSEEPIHHTKVDYKRTFVFFIWGTFIGGPSYHYWFNYLNELPALLWKLKQTQQRGKILRAYAYLKSHKIEVKLDLHKLPKSKPLGKWEGKAAKILADQLIFSSTYLLAFFISIGMMNGAVNKLEKYFELQPVEEQQTNKYNPNHPIIVDEVITRIKDYIMESDKDLTGELEQDQSHIVDQIIEKLNKVHRELKVKDKEISWQDIWNNTITKTKSLYLETYIADCILWPPLQLINFTFVPLRYQFLFVNGANLAWNTFLSFMANKSH